MHGVQHPEIEAEIEDVNLVIIYMFHPNNFKGM
jgi:hypothetical protein